MRKRVTSLPEPSWTKGAGLPEIKGHSTSSLSSPTARTSSRCPPGAWPPAGHQPAHVVTVPSPSSDGTPRFSCHLPTSRGLSPSSTFWGTHTFSLVRLCKMGDSPSGSAIHRTQSCPFATALGPLTPRVPLTSLEHLSAVRAKPSEVGRGAKVWSIFQTQQNEV